MEKKTAQGTPESATAGVLRTIDEVRSLLDEASSEDLAERTAAVRKKLEASREALERASREKSAPLEEALLGVERSIREDLAEVEERIRQNPMRALLASAAVGLLLGLLISRQH